MSENKQKSLFQKVRKFIVPLWILAALIHFGYKGQAKISEQELERKETLVLYLNSTFLQTSPPYTVSAPGDGYQEAEFKPYIPTRHKPKEYKEYEENMANRKQIYLNTRDDILAKSGKLNKKCNSSNDIRLVPRSQYINIATSPLLPPSQQPERNKPWPNLFQKHFPGYSVAIVKLSGYEPFKGAVYSGEPIYKHEYIILVKFNKSNGVDKIIVPRISYNFWKFNKYLPEVEDINNKQVEFLKDFLSEMKTHL